MLDKQKGMGEIVKRVIIVIVLLGITPTLFREAFTLQNYLVKQNVIGKIFSNDSNINSDDVGRNLAWYGFSSFFTINPDAGDAASKCSEVTDGNMEYDFKQNGSLISAYKCVNMESDGNTLLDFLSPINSLINNRNRTFVIDFEANGLVPFLVGVLILWVIIVYTIQLGVRLLQLAYLQLVAPIPIMMYLEPKKNDTLGKWANQCLVTFLDFFIRIAIMYFAIFIIDLIIKNGSSSVFMATFGNSNLATKLYINIIMIIAVLIFVKRVPNLLKEVFPALNSAATLDFGLKPPKEAVQVTKAITGAATAGAIGLIGGGPGLANKLMGFAGGALKGGYGGFKGDKLKDIASARAATNLKNRQIREDPNTTLEGRMEARFRNAFGFNSIPEEIDKQINAIDKNNIRPLQDRIKEIDNDPLMKQKKSNDTVISSYKNMMDEAEKNLLKSDKDMIQWKNRLDYLKTHLGEKDNLTGLTIDGDLIEKNQSHYKSELDKRGHVWIDNHSSGQNANEVITRNMEVITKEVGHSVSNAAAANTESKGARQRNASIAPQIVNLEYEKANNQKQIDGYEKQKEQLNRSKEAPQADLNAINKK